MKKSAVNAILEVYKKVIIDLKIYLNTISDEQLVLILDSNTKNNDCKSIQNILSHTINAGYSYLNYIQKNRDVSFVKPESIFASSVIEYQNGLEELFHQTVFVFQDIFDEELEKYKESDKILTGWNQYYDIEQIMEHAIVHIMRHQLQIKNLIKNIDN